MQPFVCFAFSHLALVRAVTPPLLLLCGPGLVLARVRDGVAAASRQRTAECVGVDSGRRAGVSCCLQFEPPCGVSNGRQHGQLHVCCLRGSTSQPGLRPPSLWACAALPRRPQDPAGAQRCPSGFSASPRLPAWCEATAQGARVAPHGGRGPGPDVELGGHSSGDTNPHCRLF